MTRDELKKLYNQKREKLDKKSLKLTAGFKAITFEELIIGLVKTILI